MAAATAVRSILRSTSVRSTSMTFAWKSLGARSRPLFPKIGPAVSRSLRSSEVTCFCLESLLPMHSATASALMTSLLSFSIQSNGFLSKGIVSLCGAIVALSGMTFYTFLNMRIAQDSAAATKQLLKQSSFAQKNRTSADGDKSDAKVTVDPNIDLKGIA